MLDHFLGVGEAMDWGGLEISAAVSLVVSVVANLLTTQRENRRQQRLLRARYRALEGEYQGYVFRSDHTLDRANPSSTATVRHLEGHVLAIIVVERNAANKWNGEMLLSGVQSGSVTWRYQMWHGEPARETDISGTKRCIVEVMPTKVVIHMNDDNPPDFGREVFEKLRG